MMQEKTIKKCKLIDQYLAEGMTKRDAYKKANCSGSLHYEYLKRYKNLIPKKKPQKFIDLVEPKRVSSHVVVMVCSLDNVKQVLESLK